MAPAIAHFLVGAGVLLLVAAPIAYRYELDHTLTLALVPIGGIWGLIPDVHHIAPTHGEQLYALHNSPWVDLFGLHYLLDTPTVRGMYYESVFGSILFFSIAVAACTAALRARSSRLHPAIATVIATGYGGIVLSVLAVHQRRYDQLAALVGSDGLLVGWLVLAAGTLLAGTTLTVSHEVITIDRLLPALDRRTPAVLALASVPFAGVLWIGAIVTMPAWFRIIHGDALATLWIEWVALLWVFIFAIVFSAVYGFFRVNQTK